MKVVPVALSEIDRSLLDRCLNRKPRAWEDFVDRFMGLVVHVINHTAQCRSINLSAADREDLAAEVFLAIVDNDMAVLRHFRGKSSLATYLTVIARRVVVRKLVEGRSAVPLGDMVAQAEAEEDEPEQRIGDREEVGRLLGELQGSEADGGADVSPGRQDLPGDQPHGRACPKTAWGRCSAGPARSFAAGRASMGRRPERASSARNLFASGRRSRCYAELSASPAHLLIDHERNVGRRWHPSQPALCVQPKQSMAVSAKAVRSENGAQTTKRDQRQVPCPAG